MTSPLRRGWLTMWAAIVLGACASVPTEALFPAEPATPKSASVSEAGEAPGPAAACPGLHPHPIAAAIADDFDIAYEEVINWFCGGSSFEDIMLALQTERLAPVDAAALLAEREQGKTWEVIWVELGITAK